MYAVIEQHSEDKLRLICPQLGASYGEEPIYVGDERFIELMAQLRSVDVQTLFGHYVIYRRRNQWVARATGFDEQNELKMGRAETFSSQSLDNAALTIHGPAAPITHAAAMSFQEYKLWCNLECVKLSCWSLFDIKHDDETLQEWQENGVRPRIAAIRLLRAIGYLTDEVDD